MILGIHHMAVSVTSIDRSLAFYCGVLGAEVCSEFEWRPGQDVIDGILGLRNSSARTAMIRFGNVHLAMLQFMGDIAATYGRDPDGNVIELQEVLNSQHSTHVTNLPGFRER